MTRAPIGDTTAWVDAQPPAGPPTTGTLLRWLLRHQRATIAIGMTSAVLWMGSIAAVPPVLGRAIDAIGAGDASGLLWWLVVLAMLAVLQASAAVVRHWHATLIGARSGLAVTHLVAARGLEPTGGLERHLPSGEAVSRATSDAEWIGGPVDLMCRGSAAVVVFIGVAVAMVVTSPPLGLLIVVGLPPLLLVMVPLWRPLDRRAGEQQATLAAATTLAADTVAGLGTVKGLGIEDAVKARYRAGTAGVRHAAMRVARLSAGWDGLRVAVPGLFLAAIAWLGGRLALEGRISPGELVAFLGYATFLVEPIATFAELGRVWARGIASARRVADMLALPPAVAEGTDGARVSAAAPSIELAGVSLADAGSARPLLDHVDLQVQGGRRVGIVCADPDAQGGIVDLLARDRDPDQGAVRVDGIDVRALRLDRLRAVMVVGDREAFLFTGTLEDNLRAARPRANPSEVDAALAAAAAQDIAAVEGLELVVAERGRSLSGGQRQRVALARTVLTDAPVLVLEDPASAVDAVTEQRLVAGLLAARRGRTTILLTSSPALLAALDEAVWIDAGRVAARGSHTHLLAHAPAYRAAVLATKPGETS